MPGQDDAARSGARPMDSTWQKLLRSHEKPYGTIREVGVGALVVVIVLGTLWGVTGQPVDRSPVRVVTTGSMMHCSNGVGVPLGRDCDDPHFGRLGTIDPGDIFLLKRVSKPSDVATLAGGGSHHYGKSGDVVVYEPDGGARSSTPVIHRALFYLQVNDDGTFTIAELGLSHVDNLDQPAVRDLGLAPGYADSVLRSNDPGVTRLCGPLGPGRSGFITRGDNNPAADQALHSQISTCPARVAWVLGKARGEIPWVGLLRLLSSDLVSGTRNYYNAAGDTKVCLWTLLALVIGGPYAYEKWRQRKGKTGKAAP